MKLFFCNACRDLACMVPGLVRACFCGSSTGQYLDKDRVRVTGPCIVIGMRNEHLLAATPGRDYQWFVVKEPHPKIER